MDQGDCKQSPNSRKISQKDAGYEEIPKQFIGTTGKGQRCDKCSFWIPDKTSKDVGFLNVLLMLIFLKLLFCRDRLYQG
jgi:hypothetical protein